MLFHLPSCIVCLVDDEAFIELFDDSRLDLTHALLQFRRLQNVQWLESSYVQRFLYQFTKRAVELLESFTGFGRKRVTDGELYAWETLLESIVTWL